MAELTAEQLETLRQIPSPSIANAIETFDIMPRTDGFMLPPWQLNCVMYALLAVMAQSAAQLGIASDPLFTLNPPLMTYRQLGAMVLRVRDSPAGALRLLRAQIDGWEVRPPQPPRSHRARSPVPLSLGCSRLGAGVIAAP